MLEKGKEKFNEINLEIKQSLKNYRQIIKQYQVPNNKKAIIQILNTFLPFIALWIVMYFTFQYSLIITMLLAMINAFFLVRVFIIQHDCGHQSFFKSRKVNNVVGTVCSWFSTIPFKYWSLIHAFHHSHNGQLEVHEIGDIPTITVNEFRSRNWWGKLKYRIWRNPFVTFLIAPIYYLTISNRTPSYIGKLKGYKKFFRIQVKENLAMLAVYLIAGFLIGWKVFLFVQLFTVFFFGIIAFWNFYVQHQHEESYKQWKDNWDNLISSIRGTTYYKLPKLFQWLTGNIGIHHIHHLSSKIPNYNLQKCIKENAILTKYVTVVTFTESLKYIFCKLWDEDLQKMISFREFYRLEKVRVRS